VTVSWIKNTGGKMIDKLVFSLCDWRHVYITTCRLF